MMPDPLLEINPEDATPRRIRDGEMVLVTSSRGTVKIKAKVTNKIL